MAQIFSRRTNRTPVFGVLGLLVLAPAVALGVWYYFSPEYTDVGYAPEQPVPYSHRLHVGELGMDCRYCHAQVERSAVATVPTTQTCMNCHTLVGRDLASLEPIRESMTTGRPMRWVRVHDLPDYAYFDHSAHLAAGVGCSSCHGDVAAMEVVRQVEPLSMAWCLDCHRDPDPHIRPADELTNTRWEPPENQREIARAIRRERGIAPSEDCSTCHR